MAKEVEDAGGKALALQVDVRDEVAVREALAQANEHFGGIDALINNAGAIKLTGVQHIELKRFDLMHQINTRAVLLCSQAALPYLKKASAGIIASQMLPRLVRCDGTSSTRHFMPLGLFWKSGRSAPMSEDLELEIPLLTFESTSRK